MLPEMLDHVISTFFPHIWKAPAGTLREVRATPLHSFYRDNQQSHPTHPPLHSSYRDLQRLTTHLQAVMHGCCCDPPRPDEQHAGEILYIIESSGAEDHGAGCCRARCGRGGACAGCRQLTESVRGVLQGFLPRVADALPPGDAVKHSETQSKTGKG